jgi:hypothetical protein
MKNSTLLMITVLAAVAMLSAAIVLQYNKQVQTQIQYSNSHKKHIQKLTMVQQLLIFRASAKTSVAAAAAVVYNS